VTDTLVRLAGEYVAAHDQLARIRAQMIKLLANGAGGDAEPIHPTQPGERPAKTKTKSKASKPDMRAAAKALDATTLDLIRAQPGMKTGEIRQALAMKPTTATERLKRLKGRGLIEPTEGGGWQVAATA
jgi:hypothetical protein